MPDTPHQNYPAERATVARRSTKSTMDGQVPNFFFERAEPYDADPLITASTSTTFEVYEHSACSRRQAV